MLPVIVVYSRDTLLINVLVELAKILFIIAEDYIALAVHV